MSENLNDGRQILLNEECDCCKEIRTIYDMGSHFVCKKCFIEMENNRLKDKKQKTLI